MSSCRLPKQLRVPEQKTIGPQPDLLNPTSRRPLAVACTGNAIHEWHDKLDEVALLRHLQIAWLVSVPRCIRKGRIVGTLRSFFDDRQFLAVLFQLPPGFARLRL